MKGIGAERRGPADELLEAGAVTEIQELRFRAHHHRAQTSRWLAFVLVGLLAFSFVGHYTATLLLRMHNYVDIAEYLSRQFEIWLPIVSALAGSAVTYYFTKEG